MSERSAGHHGGGGRFWSVRLKTYPAGVDLNPIKQRSQNFPVVSSRTPPRDGSLLSLIFFYVRVCVFHKGEGLQSKLLGPRRSGTDVRPDWLLEGLHKSQTPGGSGRGPGHAPEEGPVRRPPGVSVRPGLSTKDISLKGSLCLLCNTDHSDSYRVTPVLGWKRQGLGLCFAGGGRQSGAPPTTPRTLGLARSLC